MTESRPPSLSVVADSLKKPELVGEPDKRDGGGGDAPPPPERQRGEIWPGCPVEALGVEGKVFWYLDVLHQMQGVESHQKDRIRGIFGGNLHLLMDRFPSYNKDGKVTTFNAEHAAAAMQRAATERGVWSSHEKVRGLGAWPDESGGVILHCGDVVLIDGRARKPGVIGPHVYPSFAPGPRPSKEAPEGGGAGPAGRLLELLRTWNWERGDLDAHLLLGWICAAMFGGALDWRPAGWITGDAGMGKSTLHHVIKAVMGGERGILSVTDATEAGIRQFVMSSTTPVAIDELEAEADNRRASAIIKLARQAASGSVVIRGGADHKGAEFKARSAFLFSSILIPPLMDQDLTRLAVFQLRPFEKDTVAPKIDRGEWSLAGAGLRRRVLDNWERLHETLETFRAALARAGHSARGCDQFGTLLALADLALHNDPPTVDEAEAWAKRLKASVVNDDMDLGTDWERMLSHLLSQPVDVHRGGSRYTVGQYVMAAANLPSAPEALDSPRAANNTLGMLGLRVRLQRERAIIEIANMNSGLATLFKETRWQTPGGQTGVWTQAVRRIPGAQPAGAARSFAGSSSKAWAFPIQSVPSLLAKDDDATPNGGAPAFTLNADDLD